MRIKHPILAMLLGLWAAICSAEVVKTGYFAGLELIPMQGARTSQLEVEPAAVLIFAADSNSVQATASFDQWFRDPNRPRANAYAISVGPEDTSFEVISEILRQRELQVPTFHIRGSNLLQGRDHRLLVLDRGGKVRRELAALDFPGLNAELGGAVRTSVTTTTVSIDGGPAATPTPVPAGTTVEVESNEPVYVNSKYGMTVEFPPGWTYRVARNEDGAVTKAPRGKLDLRVWAVENAGSGGSDSLSPSDYIQQFIKSLGEQNQTEPSVDRRLVVEDENTKGRDYVFTYSKLNDPQNPAAGTTRYRARVQAFDANGILKAAGAEGPAREFDAAANSVIEPFFMSFHPWAQTQGTASPGATGGTGLTVAPARPVPTAPSAPSAPNPDGTSATPPVRSF